MPALTTSLRRTTVLADRFVRGMASRVRFDQAAAHARRLLEATLVSTILATTVHAAAPVGNPIDSTASATFADSRSGRTAGLVSNTVRTIVGAIQGASLGAPVTVRAAQDRFAAKTTLVNTGNAADTFYAQLDLVDGSAFVPASAQIVIDANGNGVADPGETIVTPGTPLLLAAGASLNLLVVGTVPADAKPNATATLRLSVHDASNLATASTLVTLIAPGLVTTSVVTSAPPSGTQGGTVTFTTTATAVDGDLVGTTVTVDGAPASLDLLRLSVPANTGFAAAGSTSGATVLYHRRNEAADTWHAAPGDTTGVDRVGFATASMPTGKPLAGSLTVTIAANANTTIANVATLGYGDLGSARSATSNTVQVTLPERASTIQMFGTADYVRPIRALSIGKPLYLQIDASGCNADRNVAEVREARIASTLTKDSKLVTVVETGVNTGIFRSATAIRTIGGQPADDEPADTLAVMKNDTVTVSTVGCGRDASSATSLVDPAGVVFDSRTDAPVAGAVVTLIDVTGGGNGGHAGDPATVYGTDGVAAYPSTLTTGVDGAFVFPLVAPSTYRLSIVAPAGYGFPSKVVQADLPAGHVIEPNGSYGGNFRVLDALVLLDVPLDAVATSGLFIEKRASKSVAEVGDFVDYTVTLRNASAAVLGNTVIHDRLPRGFAYQRGTTRIAGAKVADPAGGVVLDFAVGTLAPNQQVVLSYRLRVGVGARGGDGVNQAWATAGPSRSNTASVRVAMSDGGVFGDRGYLVGKVYADCNANGVQDPDEPGVPDVRIVLEDGTSAITDEEGKYSLYGLLPRTHVAKVDRASMIAGTALEALDSRNAGDAGSRFVDLRNGELARGDFAVTGCSPAVHDEIARRRRAVSRNTESEMVVRALLSTTPVTATDARTLPASGVIDARGIVGRSGVASTTAPGTTASTATATTTASSVDASGAIPSGDDAPATVVVPASRAASTPASTPASTGVAAAPAAVARPDLASLLPTLDRSPGFVDLVDGATLPNPQATIRTKGPAGARGSLVVNGRRIDDRQVGERSVLAGRDVAAVEYVGVDLVAGDNLLEVVVEDDFGNVRGRHAIHVRAPGRLARVVLDVPAEAKADGRTIVPVRIRLVDANDVPVGARTPVVLDAAAGRWLGHEVDVHERTVQVFVEGGQLDLELMAPGTPARTTLHAAVGPVRGEATIAFVPELRPMLAVGLVEGAINLRSLGSSAIVPATSGDVFEREISNWSRDFHDDRVGAAARGALYLKGKVLGENLLTLAYDSDKPQRERLFRDIQPDQFYPVYGDSSVKGFDAQSTSRLYVRVDHDLSYVLYGDFTTQSDDPARPLTQYNRALNGAKSRVEAGPLRVDGFAAYTDTQQVVDELRGTGTSGPYVLSRANGVTNSEQVHLITRDRGQPAVILKDVTLVRFADYEIEPFTGRLLFKAPIPSVDADLNPVYLRITYEVATGGEKFWVAGVDAKLAVTDRADVGATYVRDTDPANRATLRGVNGTVRVGEKGVLVGEFAESDSDLYGLGRGRRVEYKQDGETLQARVYAGKTDPSFNNPSALLAQGRAEYGGRVGLRLTDRDRLGIEGIRSEDPVSGGARTGVLVKVEHTFANDYRLEVGVRRASETVAPAQATSVGLGADHFTSLRTKLTVPVPMFSDANVFGEYERAIDDHRQIAAVGGSYRLPNGGKLYARHEFISSLAGAYDLNSTQRLHATVIGVDSDYMQDGHLFNEYRAGDGIDGRSAEAAIGLRNLWRIADGLAVTTTAENVKPVGSGRTDDRSNALTGAVDYTASPDWKGSGRAEYRNGSTSNSWLVTSGAAVKWSEATTLLGKAVYSTLSSMSGDIVAGLRRIGRLQFGAAYRPVDTNTWNALARIEVKRELDTTVADAPVDELATIASAHLNVSPTPDLTFSGRYGIKFAGDRANGIRSRSVTQMLGGRLVKDLGDRWDIGLNSYVLAADGVRSRTFALGAEAGYRIAKNLWASLGYNVSGFKDKDLASEEYTQRGVYLRMRYKFDENVFGGAP